MTSKLLALLLLCVATNSVSARPGGFGAGNGGLGVACVHHRFDQFGGHKIVVEDARFFDLVRWGTLEDSNRAFRYGSFTDRDAAIEAALGRLTKLRADVVPAVRREMKLIQGWVDRYITEFNNGWTYDNLESTDDYPDRPRRLYFCAGGDQAKVYQIARYQSDGRFFLMIELDRASGLGSGGADDSRIDLSPSRIGGSRARCRPSGHALDGGAVRDQRRRR